MSLTELIGSAAPGIIDFIGDRNSQNDAMEFSRRMRGSAYQAAVRDMRRAGLNPILAAMNPASSPSGTTTGSTHIGSSALQARRLETELEIMEEQARKLKSETALTDAMKLKTEEDTKVSGSTAKIVSSQIPRAENLKKLEQTPVLGRFFTFWDRIWGRNVGAK